MLETVKKIKEPKPFVKWVGGKRQLVNEIHKRIPLNFNRYYEPFIGGGAVFFSNGFNKAIISDVNQELINAYNVIKENVDNLIISLKKHLYNEEYFYELRKKDTSDLSNIERASRFIYLNKTCYNGLYRVNKKGKFNVPFGKYKSPLICDEENLKAVNYKLIKTKILCTDFEKSVLTAKENDFVYFDPPYMPLSSTSYFVGYSKNGFAYNEQLRLKNVYKKLSEKGVYCMLSNSYTNEVKELYSEYNIDTVKATRVINSKANGRGKIKEVIITNYENVS